MEDEDGCLLDWFLPFMGLVQHLGLDGSDRHVWRTHHAFLPPRHGHASCLPSLSKNSLFPLLFLPKKNKTELERHGTQNPPLLLLPYLPSLPTGRQGRQTAWHEPLPPASMAASSLLGFSSQLSLKTSPLLCVCFALSLPLPCMGMKMFV